jgi:acetyl esterase
MPVDPPIQGMLSMLASMNRPPMSAGTPEAARSAFRMLTVDFRPAGAIVPVAATEDLEVPCAAGALPARMYRPDAEGQLPTIVFFHGGGFVLGDVDTHDNQCRALCREAEAVVLSVGYRLAPEHPFPAAPEDCFAATRWAAEHVDELGGDAARIAVAGDSAGGNLAAVTALMARDAGGPPLAAQLLIYPGTDFVGGYPSETENGEGYFLTRDDMEWFREQYLAGADPTDPRLSPVHHADLAGLPPAVVITAEFDPLRDQGDAYARALEEAGVLVIARSYGGLIHGFFDLGALSPACAEAVREVCADLRGLLRDEERSPTADRASTAAMPSVPHRHDQRELPRLHQ